MKDDNRQANAVWRFVLMTVIGALIVMAILVLSSCAGREQVVEHTLYIHDTIQTVRIDTVEKTRKVVVTDTVRQSETHYVYTDSGGHQKEVHIYNNTERIRETDSSHQYISRLDSLQKAVSELRNDKSEMTVVRKVIPKWVWLICFLSVIMFFGYVLIARKWFVKG